MDTAKNSQPAPQLNSQTPKALEQLEQLIFELGFNGYCLSLFSGPHIDRAHHQVYSSHPEWLNHYRGHDFQFCDPVMVQARRSADSFVWRTHRDSVAKHSASSVVLDDAREFGFLNGLTIPIHAGSCRMAVLSMTVPTHTPPPLIPQAVEMQIVDAIRTLASAQPDAPAAATNTLSAREIACLYWAAYGKSSDETAVIVDVSERTVRFHLENAKRKLNALNKTQAVTKAIARGLLPI